MLAGIKEYKDLDFYKQHSVIEFTPIYFDGSEKWKVFSVFIADTEKTSVQSPQGPFNYMRTGFTGEKQFKRYIEECTQRSLIQTDVDVVWGDKLLTLSTCTYEFDSARLVLVARQLRKDEQATVNTEKAQYNPKTVYPTAYLQAMGMDGVDIVSHEIDDFGVTSSSDGSGKQAPPSWMSEVSEIMARSEVPKNPASSAASSAIQEFGGNSYYDYSEEYTPPASSQAPASSVAPAASSKTQPASSAAPASSAESQIQDFGGDSQAHETPPPNSNP